MAKICVLVADDHAVLRSGLKLLINSQSDMQVVGEAGSHEEALCRQISRNKARCVDSRSDDARRDRHKSDRNALA